MSSFYTEAERALGAFSLDPCDPKNNGSLWLMPETQPRFSHSGRETEFSSAPCVDLSSPAEANVEAFFFAGLDLKTSKLPSDRRNECLASLETLFRWREVTLDAHYSFRCGISHTFQPSCHHDGTLHRHLQKLCETFGSSHTDYVAEDFRKLSAILRNQTATPRGRFVVISNGFCGGGVAEMFNTIGSILKTEHVDVEWHAMSLYAATPIFLEGPRKVFDAIQGSDSVLTEEELDAWTDTAKRASRFLRHVVDDDRVGAIFFEDHHTSFMIPHFVEARQMSSRKFPLRFVWRCHLDTSGIEAGTNAAIASWELVCNNLRFLSEKHGDIVIFQPGSIPQGVWTSLKHLVVFTLPPGVDLLSPKNHPPSASALQQLLTSIDNDQTAAAPANRTTLLPSNDPLCVEKPTMVTGGRLVSWKGIFATVMAFKENLITYPGIHLVIAVAVSLDDPRKSEGFRLLERLIQQHNLLHCVRVVINETSRLSALFALAALHKMPALFVSYAEGWNLMVDEASLNGAVPLTSDSGGLIRCSSLPMVRRFGVEWRNTLKPHLTETSNFFVLCDGEVVESSASKEFTAKITRALQQFLSQWHDDAAGHECWYRDAHLYAKRCAVNESLVMMSLAYLALCTATKEQLVSCYRRPASSSEIPPTSALVAELCCGRAEKRKLLELPDALSTEGFQQVVATLDNQSPMFLLDFDGTLVPIQKHPEDCFLSEEQLFFLEKLATLFPVAIVSGRSLDDIVRLVPVPGITHVGAHGFDIRYPSGYVQCIEEDIRGVMQGIFEWLSRRLATWPVKPVIEFKRACIALHFRDCPQLQEDLKVVATDAVAQSSLSGRFKVTVDANTNGMVVEIASALNWNKGSAIQWLCQQDLTRSFLPLFIGDAETDESAFAVLRRGIGIKVVRPAAIDSSSGERTVTGARFSVQTPADVWSLLRSISELYSAEKVST